MEASRGDVRPRAGHRVVTDAFTPRSVRRCFEHATNADAAAEAVAEVARTSMDEARWRHGDRCHVAILVLRAGEFDVVCDVVSAAGPAPAVPERPMETPSELVVWRGGGVGTPPLQPPPVLATAGWTFPMTEVRSVAGGPFPLAAAAPPAPPTPPRAVVRVAKRRLDDEILGDEILSAPPKKRERLLRKFNRFGKRGRRRSRSRSTSRSRSPGYSSDSSMGGLESPAKRACFAP